MNKNHMMLKKVMTSVVVASMGIATVACGTSSAEVEVTTENVEQVEALDEGDAEKLEELLDSSSFGTADSSNTKMETVYVTTSASGKTENVIVSDWLRNYEGTDTLTDTSTLSDIEDVKGNHTYTENEDGTITWQADGNDIYYQGTTSSKLPVSVKMSYTLDGESISPEDLAGKSGRVTIRFDYTNTATQTVEINGKDQKVTVPFAMVSGMILDSDKFTNIEVTNGKVISDASSNIVMGVALPGLKEALNLTDEELEKVGDLGLDTDSSIPEYVEVSADVTDFELGMTMTLASCDVLSDLGFTNLSNTDAVTQISDDMDLLQDSMTQLTDGSGELKDGAQQLRDGVYTLKDGVVTYTNGVNQYVVGVGQVAEGTKTLNDSMATLTAGTQALADGTEQLKTALAGADMSQLTSLVSSYGQVYSALQTNFGTAYQNAQAVASGSGTTYDKSTLDSKGLSRFPSSLSEADQNFLAVTGTTLTEWTYIATYSACSDSSANTAAEFIAKYKAFETKYNSISTMAGTFTTQMSQLSEGVNQLDAGADTLNDSVKNQLAPGVLNLYNGATLLNSNSAALVNGSVSLVNGVTSLASGSDELLDGIDALDSGLMQFDEEGIEKLVDAFDGDITEFTDRLVAIDEAAKNYQAFSGVSDDMTSSVKFIIETGSIETE